MSDTLHELCGEAHRNLRRTIGLLDLGEPNARSVASNLAWLQGARAKLVIACGLLDEAATDPRMLVSVTELMLKAELCLASMDNGPDELSMRLADALLLETRVRMESRSPIKAL